MRPVITTGKTTNKTNFKGGGQECPPHPGYCGGVCAGITDAGTSGRGATYGTLGMCVTWPRSASARRCPAVIQQQPGGAVQFDLGFLVGRHRRDQGGFGGRQALTGSAAPACWWKRPGRTSFVPHPAIRGPAHGRLRGLYAGAVLLHRKLRVAHFDANLVLNLLQPHLRLAIFQFGAHLGRLGDTVAQRNSQRQADTLVWSGGIDQLVQRVAIAHRWRHWNRLARGPHNRTPCLALTGWRTGSPDSATPPRPDPP